ncbi:MAG: PqiC family protein, partial [Thermodesulfobacteriota bacterium]
ETIGVSIGPVTVPEILNRPQIVIRNPRSGLQISQFNRWTEPLKTEIAAILADNIAALCGSDRIIPYTRENLFQPEYRLVIHIILLEGKPPEEIRLEAVWSIRENKTGKTMRLGKSRFQEPLISESCDDLMAAHSRILAAFSRELARELSAAIAGN